MEKLYRKKSNGRYEEVIGYTDTLSDGIWLFQTKPHSRSMSSFEDDLTNYLMKLTDSNSSEYKNAVEQMGGWISGPIGYSGISAIDLSTLFLRQIAINIEGDKI
jgi:hypothetical protein